MASKYLQSVPLPEQLPKVLDALLKAVLRDQPKDIIRYCADYFSALEGKQLRSSQPELLDKSVRQSVEKHYARYFRNGESRVQKEEVIKFMRSFAGENELQREPFPNSIEEILQHLKGRTELGREEFIDTVTEFFSS
jgi:hypothetical protein